MSYTTNPQMPRLRARAVNMERAGKTGSEAARYFGYTKGAVSKCCNKMSNGGSWTIPTESSRPHHHPNELTAKRTSKIIEYKIKYRRCSKLVQRPVVRFPGEFCQLLV